MLNERTYQILASGGFQVCDYVPKMETFFPEESLVTAKSEKEWVFKVNYFLNNPDLRLPYIDKGMEAVKKFSYDKIMQKLINIIK